MLAGNRGEGFIFFSSMIGGKNDCNKERFLRVDGDDFSAFVKYDPVLNSREEVRYAQSLYVATVSSSKCYISPELSDAGWRIIVYDWGGKEGGAREGLRGHDQRIVLPEYIPSRLDPFLWLSGALHEIGHAYDFAEMSESERSSIDDEYSLFHELVSLLRKEMLKEKFLTIQKRELEGFVRVVVLFLNTFLLFSERESLLTRGQFKN